jgi:hypothetical protein
MCLLALTPPKNAKHTMLRLRSSTTATMKELFGLEVLGAGVRGVLAERGVRAASDDEGTLPLLPPPPDDLARLLKAEGVCTSGVATTEISYRDEAIPLEET